MIDPLVALRQILLAEPAIQELCENRVYVGEMAADEVKDQARKAVVLTPTGGVEARGTSPIMRSRFTAWSYGESLIEAGVMDRAVQDCLKHLQRRTVDLALIHAVFPARSATGRDANTGWPLQYSAMTVIFDEREIG